MGAIYFDDTIPTTQEDYQNLDQKNMEEFRISILLMHILKLFKCKF